MLQKVYVTQRIIQNIYMTRFASIAFLTLSWTQLFSQSIQKETDIRINSFQARAILKNYAELGQLRGIIRIDSGQIDALTKAYYYKDSAFQSMTKAQVESSNVAQEYHAMYVQSDKSLSAAKKEIRRQKRIKILTMIGAGVIVLIVL